MSPSPQIDEPDHRPRLSPDALPPTSDANRGTPAGATPAPRHASNCRWAVPTIFLAAPFWWESERCEWSCVRGDVPRLLQNTTICKDCPYWVQA